MRSNIDINQCEIEDPIKYFLDGMGGGEALPDWLYHGICHAYTFLMWRASIIGDSEKFLERLIFVTQKSKKEMKQMGALLTQYNKFNETAIEDSLKSLRKKLKATIDDAEIEKIKAEMKTVREEHYSPTATAQRMQLFLEINGYGDKERDSLTKGRDFYGFVVSLVGVQNPGYQTGLKVDERVIRQSDYLSLLNLIPPNATPNQMKEEKLENKEIPKNYLTKAYSIAFNFQPEELKKALGQIVQEGDFIRLGSTDHSMFLTLKNGQYELYDSNSKNGVDKYPSIDKLSIDKLVDYLEYGFYGRFDETSDFLSLSVDVYEKSGAKSQRKESPTAVKIISEILDSRPKDVDINSKSYDGTSGLFMAAKNGCKEIVNELLKRGANPNVKNEKTQTPLHVAAYCGYPEIVESLALAKADVNFIPNDTKATALQLAVGANDAPVIKMLVKYGANAKQLNESKQTLVQLAAIEGNAAAITALVEGKANINDTWKDRTPLMLAVENGHVDVIKSLVALKADVNAATPGGTTPVLHAVNKGHQLSVKALLEAKADFHHVNENGDTSFSRMAIRGDVDILKVVRSLGVDINKLEAGNWTAMHYAAQEGHSRFIKLLVKYNADLNATTIKGNTGLYLAAQGGHAETITVLIESKADVNLANKFGVSPALIAVHVGHLDVIKAFATANANFNQPDTDGETPLQIATTNKRWDMVIVMLASLKNEKEISPAIIKILIEHQKDLSDAYITNVKTLNMQAKSESLQSLANSGNALANILKLKETKSELFFDKERRSAVDEVSKILSEFKFQSDSKLKPKA